MKIKEIEVKNFRLLHDVSISLEQNVTVIVGKNNSGKSSLIDLMQRLFSEKKVSFSIEDFSAHSYSLFLEAFECYAKGADESDVRRILPIIEARLTFSYGLDENLGALSDLIMDLDPECTEALAIMYYQLKEGALSSLFAELEKKDLPAKLHDRVPLFYEASFYAVDPNNASNRKEINRSVLEKICSGSFINAQRGLDDVTEKERIVLGKMLENIFFAAKSSAASQQAEIASELESAVRDIQEKIKVDFNEKLNKLIPALSILGYPGFNDPRIITDTTLNVRQLLTNHTKLFYEGSDGLNFPESYSGLGMRNIILILLKLVEFYRVYQSLEVRPPTQIIFIEEPEAHLHPQIQEVFIRKINEVAAVLCEGTNEKWPVQFVVSTHSSHIANAAMLSSIRYFLVRKNELDKQNTEIRDLRKGLAQFDETTCSFLQKFITLSPCDLFFADKVIFVEGIAERLMVPVFIQLLEKNNFLDKPLSTQYLSIVEIGGAHAHRFFELINFLELPTLIITDIDSVKKGANGQNRKCIVSKGESTSNYSLRKWFGDESLKLKCILNASNEQRTRGNVRITYQTPEEGSSACGRTFEESFMLANKEHFNFTSLTANELESELSRKADNINKSDFALEKALSEIDWNTPNYIKEGLKWLSEIDNSNAMTADGGTV